jgi:hypothetical protein
MYKKKPDVERSASQSHNYLRRHTPASQSVGVHMTRLKHCGTAWYGC